MGRVSRYKKVKSVDPFAKNGSWKAGVGDCAAARKAKRRSATARRLKERRASKRSRGRGGGRREAAGGGSNGFGDDDGLFDLPAAGGDEWDLSDPVGSLRKQRAEPVDLDPAPMTTVTPSRGTDVAPVKKKDNAPRPAGNEASSKSSSRSSGDLKITSKTPTREIFEACSHRKSQRKRNGNAPSEPAGPSKKERKKAFLTAKKSKKRRRGDQTDERDDEEYFRALQSSTSNPERPRKHTVKQPNYSGTLIARSAIGDQVERPPTFSALPRGARRPKKSSGGAAGRSGSDDNERTRCAERKRREMEMEALRQRVMLSYAKLRESRRNGDA